jgi:hypothetical protein
VLSATAFKKRAVMMRTRAGLQANSHRLRCNVSEDGTVRVCKNCLKENYNRAATEREFAFIKYNSIL